MKKVEKSIKDAKKTVEKFSKEKQSKSTELKACLKSIDKKIKEMNDACSEITVFKNSIKEKKKNIEGNKLELKELIFNLNKLSRKESKELLLKRMVGKTESKKAEPKVEKKIPVAPVTKTPVKKPRTKPKATTLKVEQKEI